MGSVSTRLDSETEEEIRETAADRDVSLAEVVRELIKKGIGYDQLKEENEQLRREKQSILQQWEEHTDLIEKGKKYDQLEEENERLRQEKRLILEQREEHTELVEYAEREKSLQTRRQERKDAPIWKRSYWWIFGRDNQDALAENEP